MDQPGNESLTVAHHFRIKNGQNPHDQPGGRQTQRQKGLAAIQISGGRIQQTDPSPGRHGRRRPQGDAPERLGKDSKAFKRGTVQRGGIPQQMQHHEPGTGGNEQGGQNIHAHGTDDDFTHEQAAGKRGMKRRREPGCRSAADQQPEPRNGHVQTLPHSRRNQGGRLDDRPFLADGRAGSDAPCRGKNFQGGGPELDQPVPDGHGLHVFRSLPRHPFLQE